MKALFHCTSTRTSLLEQSKKGINWYTNTFHPIAHLNECKAKNDNGYLEDYNVKGDGPSTAESYHTHNFLAECLINYHNTYIRFMNELGSFVFCGEENGFGRKLEDSIRRYCRGDGKFFENMFENDQLKSFIVFVQRNPELFTFSKNLVVYCQIVVNLKTTFKTAEEVKLIRYVETTKDTFGEDSEEAKAAKEKLDAVLEKKKLLPALTAPPVIPLIQDAARDSNGERLIPKSEVDKMIEEAVAETVKKQKSVREKYQNSYKELEIELQDVKEKLQHAMERKEKYKKDVEHLEEKIEDHQQLLEENPVLKRSYIDAIKKEKTRKNKDVDDGNKASKRQKIQ